MAEVPRKLTPLPEDETATVILNAWSSTGLALPTRRAAALLLSLVWLENSRGAAFNNFNWGNLSTAAKPGVDFWRPPWFDPAEIDAIEDPARRERMIRLHQEMVENRQPSAFLAFGSHLGGARTWINRLHEKFPSIVDAARTGDVNQFAQAYHSSGYCPSPECEPGNMTPSFAKLSDEIEGRGMFSALSAGGTNSRSDPAGRALLIAGGSIGVAAFLWWRHRRATA